MNGQKSFVVHAVGILLTAVHLEAGVGVSARFEYNGLLPSSTHAAHSTVEPDSGSMILARKEDFEMSSRGGARVVLYGHDGSQIYGDLLAIDDSVVSLYAYADFSYSARWPFISGVNNFRLDEVERIVVKGRAHVLEGMVIGVLGGMFAGTLMTRVMDRELPSVLGSGPAILGGAGLVSGAAIGYLTSSSDMEISVFSQGQIAMLQSLSRTTVRPSR